MGANPIESIVALGRVSIRSDFISRFELGAAPNNAIEKRNPNMSREYKSPVAKLPLPPKGQSVFEDKEKLTVTGSIDMNGQTFVTYKGRGENVGICYVSSWYEKFANEKLARGEIRAWHQ